MRKRKFTQVDTSTNSLMEKGTKWDEIPIYDHPKLHKKKKQNKFMKLLYTVFSVLTAMIGYTIHGSVFWAIMDFIFTPIAWIKWLVCHEVSLSVIQNTFTWFFK